MSLTLVHDFNSVTFNAGDAKTLPPAGGVAVPSNVTGYVLWVQQLNGAAGGWVHDGSAALRIDALQVSYDGGTTWGNLITNEMLNDVAIPATTKGSPLRPADTFPIAASLQPQVGGTQRQLRLSYTVFKTVQADPQVYTDSSV